MISGVFVVIANAWMNAPTGFTMVQGKATDIDPIAAIFNAAAFQQTLHMTVAAYTATGMAVAGIHAFLLLRSPTIRLHRAAMTIALWVGVPAALLQPESGHLSARWVAERQPVKLAAMEGQFLTEAGAPLRIGGIPDETAFETRGAIELPYGLSILAFNDPFAVVQGLDSVPRDQWPPVAVVHVAFQVMVALGTLLSLAAGWVAWRWIRKRAVDESRGLLRLLALCAPLGFLAIEAGWIVTEVGRQPWIVYKVLRTAQAVTPMPGLGWSLAGFSLLYLFLAVIVTWLLYSQIVDAAPALTATRQPGPDARA
jgi:cytochrome d ubiquinol oxidase subunit I